MSNSNLLSNIFPTPEQIPAQWRIKAQIIQKEYLVDGELRQWNGKMNDIVSPVYLKINDKPEANIIGQTPMLTEKEALEALEAATNAYNRGKGEWPTMSLLERIEHVEYFLVKMKAQHHEIVKLLMWEIGKTYPDADKEFTRTVEYIEDTIKELKNMDRRAARLEIDGGIIAQIRRVPIGVALCMGPYNYPLNETFTTLIPALLMGNTVVFKPAKFGVLLIKPLLEAFRDCFPKGVINVIYGKGRDMIGALMETGRVDLLAFIGTHEGANNIKKLHPKPNRLKSILGLDAKNPAIVLQDADIDLSVAECIAGSLAYNGQRCTALKIIFVHESIVAEFNEKFIAAVNALKAGMPWEEGVKLTPLPELTKPQYLNDIVADAQQKGAEIININGGLSNESFFYPAVLYPVNSDMKIYHEEQFGPVVPIVSYKNIDEPIQYVIDSDFGQQASIFGNDSKILGELIDVFINQVSRLNINTQCQRGPDSFPFTGRKDSAEGTLSVVDALRAFSIRAMVATKENDHGKKIIQNILKDHNSNFVSLNYMF